MLEKSVHVLDKHVYASGSGRPRRMFRAKVCALNQPLHTHNSFVDGKHTPRNETLPCVCDLEFVAAIEHERCSQMS